jgi:hypothetical protein
MYLRSEYLYYDLYPEFFKPISKKKIAFRKKNTIIGIMKKIHSFSNKYIELYGIEHDPFHGFEIGVEEYEAPITLTDEEYEYIQNNIVNDPELRIVQKMFILQSFFGLRYVDYSNAKKDDIVNGCMLAYPKKTISKIRKVSIPLNDFGTEIIDDFNDDTDTTYLVPRYTLDQFNIKLKELFKKLGLDRIVERYDEKNDSMVLLPLYEVASSHLARRTFINTLINEGYDNISIKKMAGMSENSREIVRYYNLNNKRSQDCSNSLDKRKVVSNVPTFQFPVYQTAVPIILAQ